MDINKILEAAHKEKASDVHITVGLPPKARVAGQLIDLEFPTVTPEKAEQLAKQVLNDVWLEKLNQKGEVDLSYNSGDLRYRVSVYIRMGYYTMAMRAVNSEIPNPIDIGIPDTVINLYKKQRGLILVTGPTGSGKTTTIATLIDAINRNRSAHIITMEEPIEFLHTHHKSMINQREIGQDTKNYASALKAALREDPDVIFIGEMRDLETISTAITAAETGHLVLSTLHTMGVANAVDRIIDVFPSYQQQQIRAQLASVLEAVIYQQLVPSLTWKSRVPAFEIMTKNYAVRNLIREGKTHMLDAMIQNGRKDGMILMDDYLKKLSMEGKISKHTEETYAFNSSRRIMY
ncbi:MAG: type IV pilus twitching motility protein PilT [Clostridia bacterium]|nr:type IV pilus twitching motility protein PilT [Clostridia bacterium]